MYQPYRSVRLAFLIFQFLLFSFLFASCTSEETFPTGAGDRLQFSVDTLRMDTIISGQTSIVRSFSIYNNNSDGFSITAVNIQDNQSDSFHVNVDGTAITGGNLATSIDCRSKDSLQVFVSITPPAADRDDKVLHEARLLFTLANGVTQSVVLSAYSQDVITLRNHVVQTDETLSAQRPYLVVDSLTVASGATLTLQAGVRLLFQSNALLHVDGTLVANGTREKPVQLRGDRMDFMFVNQPYDRVSGQWQGVVLGAGSFDNNLNYTDIHSGSYGIRCEPSNTDRSKLILQNSVLHNVTGHCLQATACKLYVGNSQISNAGGHCVSLAGGDAQFVHCTIAQFYPFSGLRAEALYYTNVSGGNPCPLLNALFQNCIITGYSDDEVSGVKSSKAGIAFNYGFYNCLLNTAEVSDDQVLNNAWDTDKKTKREDNFPAFNMDYLLFDFRPVAASRAVGLGDPSVTAGTYAADRNGIVRLTDGKSDAGCYEHIADKE